MYSGVPSYQLHIAWRCARNNCRWQSAELQLWSTGLNLGFEQLTSVRPQPDRVQQTARRNWMVLRENNGIPWPWEQRSAVSLLRGCCDCPDGCRNATSNVGRILSTQLYSHSTAQHSTLEGTPQHSTAHHTTPHHTTPQHKNCAAHRFVLCTSILAAVERLFSKLLVVGVE